MIDITNTEVVGWEHAIRGMRNPMNSWDRSDSGYCAIYECKKCRFNKNNGGRCIENATNRTVIGENDLSLMKDLAKAGTDHRKFMRMIAVYCDINAPMYWWKEFDTYKVGTVRNSCSTMHKIHSKEFNLYDFSTDHLDDKSLDMLEHHLIEGLNYYREQFLKTKDKDYWWQMIQMLPSSYNQKATVMLNYEVLSNMYHSRKRHKLDEWREFCEWVKTLPHSELITGAYDYDE